MRLLLDEMYSTALADALRDAGVDAVTVADLRLTGAPDPQIFLAAHADGRAVLTENVADFTRLAAERAMSGERYCGLLVALSARCSRRPAGLNQLAAAVAAVAAKNLDDRVAYLKPPGPG